MRTFNGRETETGQCEIREPGERPLTGWGKVISKVKWNCGFQYVHKAPIIAQEKTEVLFIDLGLPSRSLASGVGDSRSPIREFCRGDP